MRTMRLLFSVFFFVVALGLAGCGGGGGSDDAPEDNPNNYPAGSIVNESPVASTSSWRITKIEFTGDETETYNFTYNSNGFITKVQHATDSNYYMTFTFNSDGYLTQSDEGDGVGDVTTVDYTYSGSKLKSKTISSTETSETDTYTFDQWNGYYPVHASFSATGDSFTGTWTGTIDSNGRFTAGLFESLSSTPYMRMTITYGDPTVTYLREDYEGSAWENETIVAYTYDSNGRQTKNEMTEYDSDGSYDIKTLEYTYNSDGNISSIKVTRKHYNSSGVLTSTRIYTGAVTYESNTSRPAPNDIVLRRYDSFFEYACERLD